MIRKYMSQSILMMLNSAEMTEFIVAFIISGHWFMCGRPGT